MFAELKSYSEYKPSGTDWLGDVPAHWEIRPAFGVYSPNLEKNIGMKEKTVLSLSYGHIVIKPTEKLHGLVPESFETYQIVNPGDIVLRTTDLQNDHTSLRVGMVRNRGIITSAYLVLRTRADVDPNYGYQVLNAWDLSKAIYRYGSGLRQNLDFTHFKRMHITLPPHDEQSAIIRFLVYANRQIEYAIQSKRKLITLLNEQRQVIIHRAVTRGLDSHIRLKASGAGWLGDVPEHWEVRKLKFEMSFCGGGTPSKANSSYWNGNIPWVSPKDMKADVVDDAEDHITERAVAESSTRLVPAGSLLMVVRSGILQRTIPVALCSREVALNQDMKALNMKGKLGLEYFVLLVRGCEKRLLTEWRKQGATVESIEHRFLANTKVPVPPLKEQEEIVSHVATETEPIRIAMNRARQEIDFIQEYRTRLITDVVTGKLDVRDAASKLPAEEESEAPVAGEEKFEEEELEPITTQE